MKDALIQKIAQYTAKPIALTDETLDTAAHCLGDAMGCAILSLNYPACTKLLGPVIRGTQVPGGSRVPGTSFILDPIRAAFNFGTMIRWLDYNDTWLAKEWGHPSDNLGGILMVADYMSQKKTLYMSKVLESMIKAYEIQGVLALENSFNRVGLDHVILVKIATAAVATYLLGGNEEKIFNAVSNAIADAGPLRLYRHEPNTGSRKSWAAGDATSRGVQFAWMAIQGEMGYSQALSAPKWGMQDVLFDGNPLILDRELNSYVMDNILFKIAFPAEFHAQTAVEAAIQLHPHVKNRIMDIKSVLIETQESAVRIIDKSGPLRNPADRDHCLQYMVAIGLLKGALTADDYEDENAGDPHIDMIRSKMKVVENPLFTKSYLDAEHRSIGNAVTIEMEDGEVFGPVTIIYPIGHQKRRIEGIPLLYEKLRQNLLSLYSSEHVHELMQMLSHRKHLENLSVEKFIAAFNQE